MLQTIQQDKREDAYFKYDMTIVFSHSRSKQANQKYSNEAFLGPNLGIFSFSQNFAIREIRVSWFQIRQYNLQFPVQKYPSHAILIQKFKDFYFCTLSRRQIWRRWFQIWQLYFQIPALKYGDLTFLVPNLRFFILYTKLCNKGN